MIQIEKENVSKIISELLYKDLEYLVKNISDKFNLDKSDLKKILLDVLDITIICDKSYSRNRIKEILDADKMENIKKKEDIYTLDKIDINDVINVVESIPDELEIDEIDDYESDEFEIKLDESKFEEIDNDEEVEIECVKTNINGKDYYWNNQTNDLYDLDEKLIGKIMGNGKIIYNDNKIEK